MEMSEVWELNDEDDNCDDDNSNDDDGDLKNIEHSYIISLTWREIYFFLFLCLNFQYHQHENGNVGKVRTLLTKLVLQNGDVLEGCPLLL